MKPTDDGPSMRSVYRPAFISLPPPRVAAGPVPPRLGGDCAGVAASPIDVLLASLIERTRRAGSRLSFSPVGEFHHGGCLYRLPRFAFRGPPGGGSPIRLGIFAAIHGDEPESTAALRDLLLKLDDDPSLAQGYEIHAYPVCNPSGLEDGTRRSRSGRDLSREFWHGSKEPEIYFLERELGVHQFNGVIALHSDAAADAAYARVRGAILTDALAKPALAAAAPFLPSVGGDINCGGPVRPASAPPHGEEVLSNPAELKPLPFEIVFGTPRTRPAAQQAAATVAALVAILREYRQFLAYGENL